MSQQFNGHLLLPVIDNQVIVAVVRELELDLLHRLQAGVAAMKRSRSNYSSKFKAWLAPGALRGDAILIVCFTETWRVSRQL